MNKGGFKLRKWHTNSANLERKILEAKSAETAEQIRKSMTIAKEQETSLWRKVMTTKFLELMLKRKLIKWKFLGQSGTWKPINFNSLPSRKRSLPKTTAKIFDTLGLVTAFTIQMKVLFHEMCSTSLKWYDDLEGKLLTTWKRLMRWRSCELSITWFCDALKKAFAAVIYLRTEHANKEVEVNFVSLKTHVPLIKKTLTS